MTYVDYRDPIVTRITYAYYRSDRSWAIEFLNAEGEQARGTDWIGSGKRDALATVERYEHEYGVTAEKLS
ncbi:MAG TPA: hypothetical protein VFH61_11100 [Thermoleophilia bacterium]|nr:hypothetical protein [Thermoleophilia bacterium]